MSLFDSLASQVLGQVLGGGNQNNGAIVEVITGLLASNGQNGGLQGLIAGFEQNGLGHIVQSWIGNGTNLPISAEQITQVLGSQQVAQIGQKLGIDTTQAASLAAQFLPLVVSHISPQGSAPQGDALTSALSGVLGSFFK